MWFDDYAMGIGSFLWYWLERIGGFAREKLPHPARSRTHGRDAFALDEAGGVAVRGQIERGPVRLAELYAIAARAADRPVKACVGAGPVQLSTLAHFEAGPIKNRYELSPALADVFRAEIDDLVAAGCRHVQLEDLGAWIPTSPARARLRLGDETRSTARSPASRASSAAGTSASATRGEHAPKA